MFELGCPYQSNGIPDPLIIAETIDVAHTDDEHNDQQPSLLSLEMIKLVLSLPLVLPNLGKQYQVAQREHRRREQYQVPIDFGNELDSLI